MIIKSKISILRRALIDARSVTFLALPPLFMFATTLFAGPSLSSKLLKSGMTSAKSPAADNNAGDIDMSLLDTKPDELLNKTRQLASILRVEQLKERAENTPEAMIKLGLSPEDALRLNRAYRAAIFSLERCQDFISRFIGAQLDQEQLNKAIDSWTGFTKKELASIDTYDELLESIRDKKTQISGLRKLLVISVTVYDHQCAELDNVSARVRAAQDALEDLKNPAIRPRLQWLVKQAEVEQMADRFQLAETEIAKRLFERQLDTASEKKRFLEGKLASHSDKFSLSESELKQKLEFVEKSQIAYNQAITEAEKNVPVLHQRLNESRLLVDSARKELNQLPDAKNSPLKKEVQVMTEKLKLLELEYNTQVENISSLRVSLYSLDQAAWVWQERYKNQDLMDDKKLNAAITAIDAESAKTTTLINHITDYFFEPTRTKINSLRGKLGAWTASEGDRKIAELRLQTLTTREDVLAETLKNCHSLNNLYYCYRDELAKNRATTPFSERFSAAWDNIQQWASLAWGFELFTTPYVITIDGKNVTKYRGITVGRVCHALFVMVVGVILARLLTGGLNAYLFRKIRMQVDAALVLRKLLFYFLVFFIALYSLYSAQVPLTIFAFAGGALALAIGFGAQNLINNFISGLILLFERPVKVGSLVEMDKFRGRVTNIGARCSTIKDFDGVEMIVPNKFFLEKNIQNLTGTDERVRHNIAMPLERLPLDRVNPILTDALKANPDIIQIPAPQALLEDCSPDKLVFRIYYWLDMTNLNIQPERVASALREEIIDRIDALKAEIEREEEAEEAQKAAEAEKANNNALNADSNS